MHVNYEQSLVNMINTVPLKDYVGQLVRSILQLYMGNVGIEDGEQRNRKESKIFLSHSLIIAPAHLAFGVIYSEQLTTARHVEYVCCIRWFRLSQLF